MELLKIKDGIYVNIEHISEIGLYDRTTQKWCVKVLGDENVILIEEEKAMEIVSYIEQLKEQKTKPH